MKTYVAKIYVLEWQFHITTGGVEYGYAYTNREDAQKAADKKNGEQPSGPRYSVVELEVKRSAARSRELKERNAAIRAELAAGAKIREVAGKYGLSPHRVSHLKNHPSQGRPR